MAVYAIVNQHTTAENVFFSINNVVIGQLTKLLREKQRWDTNGKKYVFLVWTA
jgi:uncharacterized membrane protein (DUF2068 family)